MPLQVYTGLRVQKCRIMHIYVKPWTIQKLILNTSCHHTSDTYYTHIYTFNLVRRHSRSYWHTTIISHTGNIKQTQFKASLRSSSPRKRKNKISRKFPRLSGRKKGGHFLYIPDSGINNSVKQFWLLIEELLHLFSSVCKQ